MISDQCLAKYNKIFFFLLKLKRVTYCLTLIWKELNSGEFRKIYRHEEYKELRKLQFLRQQMHYFINTMEEYVMIAVIQAQWTTLKSKLAQINYFEELIALHNQYLDRILDKCFLNRPDNRLQITLNQIFTFVFKLHYLVKQYGAGICRDYQAKHDVSQVSLSFRDYSRFLYQIVRNLANKGQFNELFIRLDFNKFFANATQAQPQAPR